MADTKKLPKKLSVKTKRATPAVVKTTIVKPLKRDSLSSNKVAVASLKTKSKPAKVKRPSSLRLALLAELLSTANGRHWSLPMFLGELRKLGVHQLETCIYSAKSWFFWDDGASFEHDDERFKPYRVAARVNKEKVAVLLAYAQKDGMDYLQLFTFMADAGVHKFIADLTTGKLGFYRVDDKGSNKLVGKINFESRLENLRHPRYGDLMLTFRKSAFESWPHSRLYGAIADLGLDAYVFDFGPRVTTLFWNDGTKDFYDESASVSRTIKVASKLDKKKLAALVKDYRANKVEYPDFVSRLLKAGVQKCTTSLRTQKITYHGLDHGNVVEEKIEIK